MGSRDRLTHSEVEDSLGYMARPDLRRRKGRQWAGETGAFSFLERLLSIGRQVAVFFGGLSIKKDEEVLKKNCPHIVVGTPGRILALARNKSLNLKHIKHFILDECDKMLEQLGEWPGSGLG